jgi:subtilase family serine protease
MPLVVSGTRIAIVFLVLSFLGAQSSFADKKPKSKEDSGHATAELSRAAPPKSSSGAKVNSPKTGLAPSTPSVVGAARKERTATENPSAPRRSRVTAATNRMGNAGTAESARPKRPVEFQPHIVIADKRAGRRGTPENSGYTPAQVAHAYGFDVAWSQGYLGQGQTIAIIDAYYNPHIQQDLAEFSEAYQLPPADLEILTTGCEGFGCHIQNHGWAEEMALDVQWVHAMAPMAKILLIVDLTGDFMDIDGVNTAVSNQANVVSMSWGSRDVDGVTVGNDWLYDHPNITFVASSGDAGPGVVSYPASSQYVLAVGGTSLRLTPANTVSTETAWKDSGGGISPDEPPPYFQQGLGASGRAVPDIAFLADPNWGVATYNAIDGWYKVGGTSVGAPIAAAMIALMNNALGSPAGQSVLGTFYINSNFFFDITSGGSARVKAQLGYDLLTGLGRPYVDQFIQLSHH